MAFKLMELWVQRITDNTKVSFENHNDIYNKQALLKKNELPTDF